MELVNYKNEVLKTPGKEFDFSNPAFDPIEFSKDLVYCMYQKKGIGLSACQIGVPYAAFAMRGSPENFVCFNPRVIDTSEEQVNLEEGCLSYPGLIIKIKRPKHIRVRFSTPNGDVRTEKFTGMTARIFQHEMMHIKGEPFWKGVSRYYFDRGIRKSKVSGVSFNG